VIADDAKPAGIGADPLDAADVDAKNLPDWSPEAALAKAEAEAQSPEALAAARKKRAVRIRKEDVAPKGDSQG
jgi:myo-inositol-1(or 4)-monophosphatase